MSSRGTLLPPLPQPQVVSQAQYDASRERLRRTARHQRWVLLALLAGILYAGIWLAHGFELFAFPQAARTALVIAGYVLRGFMTVAVFLLAKQYWHIALAVVCGVLMWIPIPGAGLITLLVVNWKATRYLQSFGIKVGLLGTNYKAV